MAWDPRYTSIRRIFDYSTVSDHKFHRMGMEFPDNRRKADDSCRTRSVGGSVLPSEGGPDRAVTMTLRRGTRMYLATLVFLGGGIGSVLRYALGVGVLRFGWMGFPVATLAVNVIGGFAMGILAGWFAFRGGGPQASRLFLTTGLMGGFTTFSTFSLETMLLYEEGRIGVAAGYVGLSVALSVLALAGGLALVRAMG